MAERFSNFTEIRECPNCRKLMVRSASGYVCPQWGCGKLHPRPKEFAAYNRERHMEETDTGDVFDGTD